MKTKNSSATGSARRPRQDFTLIELLVVIGINAIAKHSLTRPA